MTYFFGHKAPIEPMGVSWAPLTTATVQRPAALRWGSPPLIQSQEAWAYHKALLPGETAGRGSSAGALKQKRGKNTGFGCDRTDAQSGPCLYQLCDPEGLNLSHHLSFCIWEMGLLMPTSRAPWGLQESVILRMVLSAFRGQYSSCPLRKQLLSDPKCKSPMASQAVSLPVLLSVRINWYPVSDGGRRHMGTPHTGQLLGVFRWGPCRRCHRIGQRPRVWLHCSCRDKLRRVRHSRSFSMPHS